MTLTRLKRALNRGTKPEDLRGVKRLAKGSQRQAWRLGNYVVKWNAPAWDAHDWYNEGSARSRRYSKVPHAWRRVPRAALREAGVMAPATWYAGPKRKYIIQRFYEPVAPYVEDTELSDSPKAASYARMVDRIANDVRFWQVTPKVSLMLDIHSGNLGIHPKSGRLVCFDW